MKIRSAHFIAVKPTATFGLVIAALVIGSATDCALANEGGGGSPLQLDRWINAVWAIGLFAVLVTILTRYGFKPVLKAMQAREQSLQDIVKETEQRKIESEELLNEYRSRLEHAETEATDLVDRSRQQAESARQEILEQAKKQAAAAIEEAERRIEIAQRNAMDEIYDSAAQIAGDIASRLINRELSDEDQARIIAEKLRKIENSDPEADN